SDLLKARMKITTYNQHRVDSFLPSLVVRTTKILARRESTLSCNQHAAAGGVLGRVGKESESPGDDRVHAHTGRRQCDRVVQRRNSSSPVLHQLQELGMYARVVRQF